MTLILIRCLDLRRWGPRSHQNMQIKNTSVLVFPVLKFKFRATKIASKSLFGDTFPCLKIACLVPFSKQWKKGFTFNWELKTSLKKGALLYILWLKRSRRFTIKQYYRNVIVRSGRFQRSRRLEFRFRSDLISEKLRGIPRAIFHRFWNGSLSTIGSPPFRIYWLLSNTVKWCFGRFQRYRRLSVRFQ